LFAALPGERIAYDPAECGLEAAKLIVRQAVDAGEQGSPLRVAANATGALRYISRQEAGSFGNDGNRQAKAASNPEDRVSAGQAFLMPPGTHRAAVNVGIHRELRRPHAAGREFAVDKGCPDLKTATPFLR
jgi:hypothetical protein